MNTNNLLNLNDYRNYLTPYKKERNCYECPSCNRKLSISLSDGLDFTCYGSSCSRSDIRKSILQLAGETTHSVEWEQRRDAREQDRVEAERVRIASLQPADVRNRDWLDITAKLQLSGLHRQKMLDRGWSPELIELSNARSTSKGRVIPITTAEGLMVGSQVVCDSGGKPWYATGTNRLLETDELPLAVIQPPNPYQTVDKSGRVTGYIAYTESVCDKPWLCAQLRNYITIGSSNIGSQPKDLERSIATIKTKHCWDEVKHVLMADGGSLVNKHVMGNYRKLNEQIKGLGGELLVGWWGQYTKSVGDIDEISSDIDIQLISFEKFERISKGELRKVGDRAIYDRLSSLTFQIADRRDEMELAPLPIPRTGHFTFVDSSVATGKTKQLSCLKSNWRRIFPDSKVFSLGYRNGLLKQQQKRLGIPHIDRLKVGGGFNNLSINHASEVGLCLDSLLEINIDDITAHTLIIHDEVEAILSHAATGGTLGGRAAQIQAHLTNIYHRVLSTGGAVVGLEDSITDISVGGLQALTDHKYPIEIISNSAEKFEWDCAIGNGKKSDFVALLLARLIAGKRIVVTTSSQKFGEMLERLVLDKIPELAGKIERIDRTTINSLKDSELLTDPSSYLRSNGIRLLILSPTVESGFSIVDGEGEPLFDRVMAYFVNLDTRSQNQLLSRYRSDCPRDIYVLEKGAEAGNLPNRDPEKLLKVQQQIANITSLEQGNGRIVNSVVGDVWNKLGAEFAARSALSSQYMREYLEIELTKRGHSITSADWLEIGKGEGLELPDSQTIRVDINAILEQLDIESAKQKERAQAFIGANGKPDVKKATAIIHSSTSSNEDRLRAEKTILTDDLPGADLTFDFILEAVVKRRGAYRRECELSYFINKPQLAKLLDRDIFKTQLDQPHIIYRRVPKLSQRVTLLSPVADYVADLSQREYSESDPVVEQMNNYLIINSYKFFVLFGLHIKGESIDSQGRRQNTSIANVNKVMRKIGYESDRVKQLGTGRDRTSIYRVINSDCLHRETIFLALEAKYSEYLASTHTVFKQEDLYIKTVCVDPIPILQEEDPPDFSIEEVEDVAAALELAVAHPEDYLFIIRSTYSSKLLQAAAQLLPAVMRDELKKLVLSANQEVA